RDASGAYLRRPTLLRDLCAIAEASESDVGAVLNEFRRRGRDFVQPDEQVRLSGDTVVDLVQETIATRWARLRDWAADEQESAAIYVQLSAAAERQREGTGGFYRDLELGRAQAWRR